MAGSGGGVWGRLTAHLDALPDDLDSLTGQVAVGRGLALTLDSLAERASFAEREARAASWEDPDGIQARIARAEAKDVEAERQLAALNSGEISPAGPHVHRRDLDPEALAARDQAAQAIREALTAVGAAHRAVLAAQLASAEQQDAEAQTGGTSSRRRLRLPHVLTGNTAALRHAVAAEYRYLIHRRPRKVLRATMMAVLSGIAYLLYVRLFQWRTYGPWAPYLAVLFVSSVMATSACFNSFCFDARRVRVALDRGARLWQVLVVKNIALMLFVLPLGVITCLVLAFLTGRPTALFASVGLVLCMLMLWSGVGNLLTVLMPIRDAPLKVHRREGTLKSFAVEFGVTWVMSSVVLFLLIWRIYSAKGMGERYGSAVLALLFLVGSGVWAWITMTVIAVAFTNQPRVYHRLRRELDWEPKEPTAPVPAPSVAAPSAAAQSVAAPTPKPTNARETAASRDTPRPS